MQKKTRRKKQQKKLFILGGMALSVCLLVFAIVYFVLRSHVKKVADDEAYHNVYVETVDVSGMKKKQAKKALENKVAEYQKQNMVLHVDDKNITISLAELGFTMKDIDKHTEKAVAYGKKGSMLSRYQKVHALEDKKKVFPVEYQIDVEQAKKVFAEKAQPLENASEDATIRRENGQFVITDEIVGKKIDIDASLKVIEKYLNQEWNKKEASVMLVSIDDQPTVTKEKLAEIQNVLGTFTTYCGNGGGRVQNIKSGTGHINGSVVMPGEEYSANAAMEPYTADNGFAMAGSYENGKVVQSMGGGICQVSSTLYNALILAELEITQRQPHSMLVSYVEPSMDAAIAGTYKDLKFKNNMDTPIYIEGYVSGGNLTFNIYGKETRAENRKIEYVSETLSSTEPKKEFVESGAELGTMEQNGSGYTGKTARLWKVVYEDGKEVSRDMVNNSKYSASSVTVNVGTASDNAEAAALVKAAIATQDEAAIQQAIADANEKIAEAEQKKAEEQQAAAAQPTE